MEAGVSDHVWELEEIAAPGFCRLNLDCSDAYFCASFRASQEYP